jgi:cytochrome c oxidase subunit 1
MFFVGGALALIRAELFQPGLQFFNPEFFNQLTTMHGLIMISARSCRPSSASRTGMIPLMIGAPDMALPRMNNFSFWLLPFAAITLLLIGSFFVPGGAPAGGWTLYPPLSLQGAIGHGRWRSSRCTSWAPRRSWARSTSSPPSSTCARRA